MDVVVIREYLIPSNPERGVQEEVFLLPNEELFSSYVEELTGVKDAVATGERYVTYEDDEAVRGYNATFPSAIQHFRSERVLIRDLKQALTEVLDLIAEVHDNGENCPYCGEDWICTGTSNGGLIAEYECPSSVDECTGNKAYAAMVRANEYLEPIRRKDGEDTRVPIVQPDGYIEGWWVTDTQD